MTILFFLVNIVITLMKADEEYSLDLHLCHSLTRSSIAKRKNEKHQKSVITAVRAASPATEFQNPP